MRINKVEDLQCWQAARDLEQLMNQVTAQPGFQKDFKLKDQIQDASASALANIGEGHEAGSDREYARFLRISKRSAGEVQCHLYVAKDRGYIPEPLRQKGYDKCEDVKRLVGGLIRYLNKPRKPQE